MNVVWHGSYVAYLEDAREAFGAKYGLEYLTIFHAGYYAPIVDMQLHYKRPLTYGMKACITITMRPTEAAKLIFDYEIHNAETGELALTASTTQVFLDHDHQLLWATPPFIEAWRKKYGI